MFKPVAGLFANGLFRGRIAVAAIAALALAPAAGWAHAILLDSTPEPGAHGNSGHVALRLRFNSRIDPVRSRLTLTRPDQVKSVLPLESGPTPDVLQAAADLGPGVYSLRWQVLAADGHITRGDVGFTLTPIAGASVAGASVAGTPVTGASAR